MIKKCPSYKCVFEINTKLCIFRFKNNLNSYRLIIDRRDMLYKHSQRNFFSFFKINSNGNSLIIHPEMGGEQLQKIEDNSTEIDENKIFDIKNDTGDENVDNDLNFITFDRNGLPIIKKTYYESLGVNPTASPSEIKTNFLKIARKFHPDKNPKTLVNFNNIGIFYTCM